MIAPSMAQSLFPLGQVVITTNACDALHPQDVTAALRRHASGDWGELCAEDLEENRRALQGSGRLFSAHRDRGGVKFGIITECDRSATTVLLPKDY